MSLSKSGKVASVAGSSSSSSSSASSSTFFVLPKLIGRLCQPRVAMRLSRDELCTASAAIASIARTSSSSLRQTKKNSPTSVSSSTASAFPMRLFAFSSPTASSPHQHQQTQQRDEERGTDEEEQDKNHVLLLQLLEGCTNHVIGNRCRQLLLQSVAPSSSSTATTSSSSLMLRPQDFVALVEADEALFQWRAPPPTTTTTTLDEERRRELRQSQSQKGGRSEQDDGETATHDSALTRHTVAATTSWFHDTFSAALWFGLQQSLSSATTSAAQKELWVSAAVTALELWLSCPHFLHLHSIVTSAAGGGSSGATTERATDKTTEEKGSRVASLVGPLAGSHRTLGAIVELLAERQRDVVLRRQQTTTTTTKEGDKEEHEEEMTKRIETILGAWLLLRPTWPSPDALEVFEALVAHLPSAPPLQLPLNSDSPDVSLREGLRQFPNLKKECTEWIRFVQQQQQTQQSGWRLPTVTVLLRGEQSSSTSSLSSVAYRSLEIRPVVPRWAARLVLEHERSQQQAASSSSPGKVAPVGSLFVPSPRDELIEWGSLCSLPPQEVRTKRTLSECVTAVRGALQQQHGGSRRSSSAAAASPIQDQVLLEALRNDIAAALSASFVVAADGASTSAPAANSGWAELQYYTRQHARLLSLVQCTEAWRRMTTTAPHRDHSSTGAGTTRTNEPSALATVSGPMRAMRAWQRGEAVSEDVLFETLQQVGGGGGSNGNHSPTLDGYAALCFLFHAKLHEMEELPSLVLHPLTASLESAGASQQQQQHIIISNEALGWLLSAVQTPIETPTIAALRSVVVQTITHRLQQHEQQQQQQSLAATADEEEGNTTNHNNNVMSPMEAVRFVLVPLLFWTNKSITNDPSQGRQQIESKSTLFVLLDESIVRLVDTILSSVTILSSGLESLSSLAELRELASVVGQLHRLGLPTSSSSQPETSSLSTPPNEQNSWLSELRRRRIVQRLAALVVGDAVEITAEGTTDRLTAVLEVLSLLDLDLAFLPDRRSSSSSSTADPHTSAIVTLQDWCNRQQDLLIRQMQKDDVRNKSETSNTTTATVAAAPAPQLRSLLAVLWRYRSPLFDGLESKIVAHLSSSSSTSDTQAPIVDGALRRATTMAAGVVVGDSVELLAHAFAKAMTALTQRWTNDREKNTAALSNAVSMQEHLWSVLLQRMHTTNNNTSSLSESLGEEHLPTTTTTVVGQLARAAAMCLSSVGQLHAKDESATVAEEEEGAVRRWRGPTSTEVDTVVQYCLIHRLSQLPNGAMVALLTALSNATHPTTTATSSSSSCIPSPGTLEALVEAVLPSLRWRAGTMSPTELTQALRATVTLGLLLRGTGAVVGAKLSHQVILQDLAQFIVDHAEHFHRSHEIASLMTSFSAAQFVWRPLSHVLATRLSERRLLMQLDAATSSECLQAFGAAKFFHKTVFDTVGKKLTQHASTLSASEVLLAVTGFSRTMLLNDSFYEQLGNRAAELAPSLSPTEKAQMLRALGHVGVTHDVLAERAVDSLDPLAASGEECAQLLIGFWQVRSRSDTSRLQRLSQRIVADVESVSEESLIGLCSVLQDLHWRNGPLLVALAQRAQSLYRQEGGGGALSPSSCRVLLDTLQVFQIHHREARELLSESARTQSRQTVELSEEERMLLGR